MRRRLIWYVPGYLFIFERLIDVIEQTISVDRIDRTAISHDDVDMRIRSRCDSAVFFLEGGRFASVYEGEHDILIPNAERDST